MSRMKLFLGAVRSVAREVLYSSFWSGDLSLVVTAEFFVDQYQWTLTEPLFKEVYRDSFAAGEHLLVRRLRLRGDESVLGWYLVLCVEPITEINPPDATICEHDDPNCFYISASVDPSREVWEIEADLSPAGVKSHWEGADERFDSRL